MKIVKILLIDDNRDLTNIMEKLLKAKGDKVISVHKCENAVGLINSQDFDTIVTNVGIYDSSRYCVIDFLESTGKIKDTNVIVLSEKLNTDDVESLKKRGVNTCFKKPFRCV